VEFDLLEVGDDVVFGSRSVVITSSTVASKRVVFEAGCMIADRCVVLPGARWHILLHLFAVCCSFPVCATQLRALRAGMVIWEC
jgi:hypothetical protein